MKVIATTKRAALFIFALASPLISVQIFPVQAKILIDALHVSVGPTMLFLVVFSFYAFAGLQLALKKQKGNRDVLNILNHSERIAALIIPIGMIGTYYALVQVLSSGSVDFSAHINALYSTLIALVTYVIVLIGSEFIQRTKNSASETATVERAETAQDEQQTTSKNALTLQQIELAGFSMGVCLFVYLALASGNII